VDLIDPAPGLLVFVAAMIAGTALLRYGRRLTVRTTGEAKAY
jgi:hypothetical protein